MKKEKPSQKYNDNEIVKVIFKNTYIGKLGVFYKDNVYDLPYSLYSEFNKFDDVEIKV
jgi:hypothetical protein